MTKCRSCSPEDHWLGISLPRKWLSASEQDGCVRSGCTDPTDLASFGEEEDDESVKLKKCFS